jgi:hypothetical protein
MDESKQKWACCLCGETISENDIAAVFLELRNLWADETPGNPMQSLCAHSGCVERQIREEFLVFPLQTLIPKKTQKKVFISGSARDTEASLTICKAIEARGYECWMFSRDVGPGENFEKSIVQAINEAALMVLVFSAHTNDSDQIKREIAIAAQGELAVIPVRIEDVRPNPVLLCEFDTGQWIDVFGNWELGIRQLLAQIAKILPPCGD